MSTGRDMFVARNDLISSIVYRTFRADRSIDRPTQRGDSPSESSSVSSVIDGDGRCGDEELISDMDLRLCELWAAPMMDGVKLPLRCLRRDGLFTESTKSLMSRSRGLPDVAEPPSDKDRRLR